VEGLLYAAPEIGASIVSVFDINTATEIATIDVSTAFTHCGGIEYDPINKNIWLTGLAGDTKIAIIDADPTSGGFNTMTIVNAAPLAVRA